MHPPVLTNIAIENGLVEIVFFRVKVVNFPYVNVYQRVKLK